MRCSSAESPPSSPHTDGYIVGFLNRHEEIRLISACPLELQRVMACKRDNITDYYERLSGLFSMNRYIPSLIFNFDETMAENRPKCTKVLVPKSCKKAIFPFVEGVLHITFAACIAADGTHMRTLVILPSKEFPQGLDVIPDCFVWSGAEAGWINSEIFSLWIRSVFIPEVNAKRELLHATGQTSTNALLLIDGHSSRHVPEELKLLHDLQIDVLCIPSHTSHVLQPLDCGVFREFKMAFRKRKHCHRPTSLPERRAEILERARWAFNIAFFDETVKEAFRACGAYPLCPEIVLEGPNITPEKMHIPERPQSKRTRVIISNRVLTTDDVIEEMRTVRELKSKQKKKTRRLLQEDCPESSDSEYVDDD